MIRIPYELIEALFGTWVAQNFNNICISLIFIGLLIHLTGNGIQKNKVKKIQKKSFKPTKWYPTGWVYNKETKLWEPPDYIQKEAVQKWRWDEEKRIWIDVEKANKKERYKQFREGKEPTFEEWKSQQEKENQ